MHVWMLTPLGFYSLNVNFVFCVALLGAITREHRQFLSATRITTP